MDLIVWNGVNVGDGIERWKEFVAVANDSKNAMENFMVEEGDCVLFNNCLVCYRKAGKQGEREGGGEGGRESEECVSQSTGILCDNWVQSSMQSSILQTLVYVFPLRSVTATSCGILHTRMH